MAVEIPVVIDIDAAFDEAAKRVDAAIKPLKRQIEDATGNIQLKIGTEWNDFYQAFVPVKKSLKDIVGLTQKVNRATGTTTYSLASSTAQLSTALEDAKVKYSNLMALQEKGLVVDYAKVDAYREAITVLSQEIHLRERNSLMVEEATRTELTRIQAIEAGNYALIQEANTISSINAKISALRQKMQHLYDGKKGNAEWTQTGKAILDATEALAKFEAKYIKATTRPGSINRITAEMRALEAQWDAMSSKAKFDANGNYSKGAQKVINKYRELTLEAERSGQSLQKAALKTSNIISSSMVPALDKANSSLSRLVTRSLYLFGLHAGMSFVRNVREVTAEFELQRVALGGIIQDTERANALFKEIKAAAVKSPFQIKDLVTYTKQLSAYRVETEKLFQITMQLADVSAGLGVDMNRLILAYGQVKAAAVLRGQELRQFTEAGIPLVKLLADKFTDLRGVMVSTADVFELISKRQVPFEMIAEIFDDMTKKGGMFYKMQEKQAETLKGQWNNLKDALSIMYDEMGNTSSVHNAMTSLINDARFLFQNWRYIADAVKIASLSFGAIKLVSLWMPNVRRELKLAKLAQDSLTRSTELYAYGVEAGSKAVTRSAARMRLYSIYMKKAAAETRLFHRLWLRLQASMAGGGWVGLAVTALITLVSVLGSAYIESKRLGKELEKIGVEGALNINRSIANFNRLADAAVHAADGSKEQREAIEELKRTYGDIIPAQKLEVSALAELQGSYESLTHAIREKISEQIREQKVSTITDEYTKKIARKQIDVKKYLSSAFGLDSAQVTEVMNAIQAAIEDGVISIDTRVEDRVAFYEKTIRDLTGINADFNQNLFESANGEKKLTNQALAAEDALLSLTNTYLGLNHAVNDVNEAMSKDIGTYGQFADLQKTLDKQLASFEVDTSKFGKRGTFKYYEADLKGRAEMYWDYLERAFEIVNKDRAKKIDIQGALTKYGTIDFDIIGKAVEEAQREGGFTKLDSFVAYVQEGYNRLVPSDKIVKLVQEKVKEFAGAYNVPMDKAYKFFKDAETSMEDYVKKLQEEEKTIKSTAEQMRLNNAEVARGNRVLTAYSESEIKATDNTYNFIHALLEYFSAFKKNQNKGYQQDPFIKQMDERMKFMKDFKKGYDDLNKYLSSTDALSKISEKMKDRGIAIGLPVPEQNEAAEALSEWYRKARETAFAKVQKTYGIKGSLTDFLRQEIKDTSNRGKALRDFQKLIQSLWDAQTDLDTSEMEKKLEDAMKKVKDEIKQSEVARNFYQDILDTTGDQELAAQVTMNVYGDVGKSFRENMQKELNAAFMSLDWNMDEMADWDSPLGKAIENIDWNTILANLDRFPKEWQKRLQEMAEADQKYNADLVKNLLKSLAGAKTYSEKRIQLANQTAQRLAQINEMDVDEDLKAQLRKQNEKKEADEAAKLLYDAFKETPMYVELFSNLDQASSRMLTNMRNNLVGMKDKWDRNLDPTQLKELQSRIDELDKQIAARNPFKALINSMREYKSLLDKTSRSKAEEQAVMKTNQANAEKTRLNIALENLRIAEETYDADSKEVQAAKDAVAQQRIATDKAEEEAKAAQETANAFGDAADHIRAGAEELAKWGDYINQVLDSSKKLADALGTDDAAEKFGIYADGISEGLSGVIKAASGVAGIIANPANVAAWVQALTGISDVVAAVFSTSNAAKIKRYNDEIERQGDLISDLERSYDRLGEALEKSFGNDYVYNFNEQLKVLEAQAAAYRAQAEAERNKGKKADERAAADYDEAAEDAIHKIEEIRDAARSAFAGSDLASAAESFADAWLSAYEEFGDTAGAIEERMTDMVKNIMKKAALSGIAQAVMGDWYKSLSEVQDWNASTIAEKWQQAMALVGPMVDGMQVFANSMAAEGMSLRNLSGQFTGIKRDIANASEESITGLAAGINTQNFYMSHIDENVALILQAMTGGASPATGGEASEYGDPYKDKVVLCVSSLPQMRDDMASIRAMLEKVIKPNGAPAQHYVAVKM